METRIVRDKSKSEGDEKVQVDAIIWATLIQESTKEVWKLSDDKVVEMVNSKVAEMLDYEATHDEWGNPVNALIIRLGKGGYSVHTVFDEALDTPDEVMVESI